MKFNEKLIELRKKAGLSQEELGYKLNVTRQTVSKWELGQTTPEMDKLSEISNIFGVSVDSLLNEEEIKMEDNKEKIEDKKIGENNNSGKKVALIIIGIIAGLTLISILMFGIIFKGLLNFRDKEVEKGTKMVETIFEKGKEMIEEQEEEDNKESLEKFNEFVNQIKDEYDKNTDNSQQANEQFEQQKNQMNEEYNKAVEELKQQANEQFEQQKSQMTEQQKQMLEEAQKQQQLLLQQMQ